VIVQLCGRQFRQVLLNLIELNAVAPEHTVDLT